MINEQTPNANEQDAFDDMVAYTIATKEVGDYPVCYIPVRGTAGAEWFSDFYLRDTYGDDYGGRHKGFSMSVKVGHRPGAA